MIQYTLVDPMTGELLSLPETELTRNLQLNVILLQEDEHIGIITHRDLVSFCRWCAGRALSQCRTAPSEAWATLNLVDKWLVDPGSVSNEELDRAAWAAALAAAEAAEAAAEAAAGAAARAAGVAALAAEVAEVAARDAEAADVSFEAQAQWLVEHLRSAQ